MGEAEHISDSEQAKGGTVLMVEDEAILRMLTAEHLRTQGFRVIEAATADEATHVLQSAEHVDLVFSDVQLPGTMGGLTFAVWIRANFPATKVILTSGSSAVLALFKSSDHVPFIPKPYDPAEVARQIGSMLSPSYIPPTTDPSADQGNGTHTPR